MTIETRTAIKPLNTNKEIRGWVPLALLAIGLPWAGWSLYATLGAGTSQLSPYLVATGWFVILGLGYLGIHGLGRMAWISAPALLTIEALIYFAVIPSWRFVKGDDLVDAGFSHAMLLILIGFGGFWLGSLILLKKTDIQFVPRTLHTTERVAFVSAAMCVLGIAGNVILWRLGLLSYLADEVTREANQGIVQWLIVLANMLTAALAVSTIEVLGKKSNNLLIKLVFVLSLAASIGFGLISGMKGNILSPFIVIVLIYGVTNGRMPRSAILLPVLLIVVVYPFVGAYRRNLNSGYRAQVDTVDGLEATLSKSIGDAFLTLGSNSTTAENGYSEEATIRLSYLSYIRDVIGLPAPSMLNGDERVWLAPIYPLVPRFLWKGKPVLDKGVRLSIALGLGDATTSVSTPIGDLYSIYGPYGVVAGMFVWGACLQLVMNSLGREAISEIRVFIYISMIRELTNLESDVVSLVAGIVQLGIVVLLLAYIVYGRRSSPSSANRNLMVHTELAR